MDDAKLAALTTYAREWMLEADNAASYTDMWKDFRDLYLAARSAFLRRFFDLR